MNRYYGAVVIVIKFHAYLDDILNIPCFFPVEIEQKLNK